MDVVVVVVNVKFKDDQQQAKTAHIAKLLLILASLLGKQYTGDVSHTLSSRLPLFFARSVVTFTTSELQ